ncbi:MAG: hemerythrin domain-containing protein [Phycisphaerae bacterium]|jgi:hemerythrin-like domain-containing protein
MSETPQISRRKFITSSAAAAGGILLSGRMLAARSPKSEPETSPAEGQPTQDILPVEDLMREHGVLRRVLLIYDESARRLEAHEDLPPETVKDAAEIIHAFIEDYHEKLEENYLFPRFRKADRLVDLVDVLLEQHKAGRRLTEETRKLSRPQSLKKDEDRDRLAGVLRRFIRMYGPHAAREDTVLFPAVHEITTATEYDKLGDVFEDKERELFGDRGFEKMVDRVADIEKSLGIYDLAQFTPKD